MTSNSFDVRANREGWRWVFFDFSGRLEQNRFITASLGIILSYMVTSHLIMYVYYNVHYIDMDAYAPLYSNTSDYWAGLCSYLLCAWPMFAIVSKRLADMDQVLSGVWGFYLVVFLPYIGPVIQFVWWLWLVLTPGTEGDNKYGLET